MRFLPKCYGTGLADLPGPGDFDCPPEWNEPASDEDSELRPDDIESLRTDALLARHGLEDQ